MHTRTVFVASGWLALLVALPAARSQSVPTVTACQTATCLGDAVARLTQDVAALRNQILQLRIEVEKARLDRLERESREADEDLRQAAAEEHGLNREVDDLRKQLLDPTLKDEQRAEILAATTEMANGGATRMRAERTEAERRAEEVRNRLLRAQEAHSELLARAATLGLTAASQPIR